MPRGAPGEGRLLLEDGEAANVLDLEDLLTTRWANASAIEAYARNFRGGVDIQTVAIPATFTATLRPYQQQGVNWLQHLRGLGLGGFLADDMGPRQDCPDDCPYRHRGG